MFLKNVITYCLLYLFFSGAVYAQKVASISIDGAINPVTADFIRNSIQNATKENAQCLIISLNTPGGLLKSTRQIVRDILSSPLPVVVYVSPGGAHAGSAGVFITLAANVAVMAPGTNIGAAHPVSLNGQMDSTMNSKITNDAAALIRTIAQIRKRNKAWAEKAVRSSASFTETEALTDSAIDFIASDMQDLLRQLDGRTVKLISTDKTLHTQNASITVYQMSMGEKMLDMLSDPNIAYILLMLGMIGLFFELSNPGVILPGIVGVIALILAFYAMHSLPVNYAGLALIIFAIILFILEIKVVSGGLLSIGGVISLLIGSMMLIKSSPSFGVPGISLGVILATTAATALFFIFVVGLGLKAQSRPVSTGLEGMIGDVGEVIEPLRPGGTVKLQGEIWNATAINGEINTGDQVRVKEMKNLVLYVEKI